MANTETTPSVEAVFGKAVLNDIRHTPQKARRVVDLIRGERVDNALATRSGNAPMSGIDSNETRAKLMAFMCLHDWTNRHSKVAAWMEIILVCGGAT